MYKKKATWRRIGILLGVLAALVVLPPLVTFLRDAFTESVPPSPPPFAEIRGAARFRLFDLDDDGQVDCVMRVPALPWSRTGYARKDNERCRGRHIRKMPDELAVLADEALGLRREHGLSLGRLFDLDGDDRVDCVVFDGTWRYAGDSRCPDALRKDARSLTEDERLAADRLLAVEREIRERWLDPLISSP